LTLVLVGPFVIYPSGAASASSGSVRVTTSPNQGDRNNQLLGVAAVSATDAWSVGYYQSAFCLCSQRTLSEHWTGTRWSIVSTPDPRTQSGDYDVLTGVAAVASGDVWAVGYAGNASSPNDRSLIEHWNGTAWRVIQSPNPNYSQDLYAAAAVSSGDAWAVGSSFNYSPYGYGALIEHWNGKAWSAVPNPATTALYGVTALASNDAWAVGVGQILHWNGAKWSVFSKSPGYLESIAAVSSSNIWAVGYAYTADGYYYHPLIEHWNGASWSVIRGASGYDQGYLFGVAAASAKSVWAVGSVGGLSFAEKWGGTRWIHVSTPNVSTTNNTLQATETNSHNVWAVGEWYHAKSPYQAQTLAEECPACS
jgi:hypothetical protein